MSAELDNAVRLHPSQNQHNCMACQWCWEPKTLAWILDAQGDRFIVQVNIENLCPSCGLKLSVFLLKGDDS